MLSWVEVYVYPGATKARQLVSFIEAEVKVIGQHSDTGRALFKTDLVALGKEYEAAEAISEFHVEDIVIAQGAGKRDVCVHCVIKPNDSMEKLYMIVMVN